MAKERPILFSAPMVRAILREVDPKTQTRRIVKPQPTGEYLNDPLDGKWLSKPFGGLILPCIKDLPMHCPYGVPGDKLWVRETFSASRDGETVLYRADPMYDGMERGDFGFDWKPSIFMPRRFSRITLEITDVRVERLQSISEADAKAEGAEMLSVDGLSGWGHEPTCPPQYTYRNGFFDLWRRINGEDSLNANPWLWCVSLQAAPSSGGAK